MVIVELAENTHVHLLIIYGIGCIIGWCTTGYGYSILKVSPLLLTYAHLRGAWFKPTCGTLYTKNALLLEPELPTNVNETMLERKSYNILSAVRAETMLH